MLLEEILLAVLWACIITLFFTLNKLGRLLDSAKSECTIIRLKLGDIREHLENMEDTCDSAIDKCDNLKEGEK
jgi:hypothetical protein